MQFDHQTLVYNLGYSFKDPSLLITAFTHRSKLESSGQNGHGANNERLEFLGDAVLSLVTANHLYRQHYHMNEGDLSRLRAQFVCEGNLTDAARSLGLGNYILSDKAMRSSGSTYSKAILADTLEALFGAVFLDGGLEAAEQVIFKILGHPFSQVNKADKDAKTKLQEMVQASLKDAPKYVVLESSGPPHAPTFVVGVKIKGEIVATAAGESKKIAAQAAAALAVAKIEKEGFAS